MTLIMTNNSGITATIYRGRPPASIYGAVDCNVQPKRPNTGAVIAAKQPGEDLPTHRIFLDLPTANSTYTPLVGSDVIRVSGSTGGHLDGDYAPTGYVQIHINELIGLNYIDLDCRYLGAKKAGDTIGANDNSGVIRFE